MSDRDEATTAGVPDDPATTRRRRYGRLPERIRRTETTGSVDTRPAERAGSPAGDPQTEAVLRTAGF